MTFICKLLFLFCALIQVIFAVTPQRTIGYQKDDPVLVECAELDDIGKEVIDSQGEYVYKPMPNCIETRKPFALTYGSDLVLQCSLREFDSFYLHLEISARMDKPLRCRIAASKDINPTYIPLFLHFQQTSDAGRFVKLITNFNSIFHYRAGFISAGSIYSGNV
ncbi:hypothetical protein BB561_002680 [Smittium simulii]|uniref:Uncharacterized protein n=1 Tax=Smittium simulii TaxID=133385 RepID=A0A2T9YPP2_9FUNG|nr:hypothetical protein BB561_002680 [Smittium simulii]